MQRCDLIALVLVAGCTGHGDGPTTTQGPTVVPEAAAADPEPRASQPRVWPHPEAKAPKLAKAADKGRAYGDRSRSLPSWESSWVGLDPPASPDEGELAGDVVAIAAPVGATPGVVRIEGSAQVVELPLTGTGRLVLAVGDDVMVRWRRQQASIHTIEDLTLLGADDRVIYASSGTGDPSFAPGWYVETKGVHQRGSRHMPGGARHEQRWLLLALGDAAALVHPSDEARVLATAIGEYAVLGGAVTWTAGKLPPDASSYEHFTLVLLE